VTTASEPAAPEPSPGDGGDPGAVEQWLFDLDGVLTDSATAHAVAWKAMFDGYLATLDPPQRPFDLRDDYLSYFDGRRRDDGIRTFLASRGLVLPETSPDDDPTAPSVASLGERKTARFLEAVAAGHISVYPDALELVRTLHERGRPMAVVSSSANAIAVLEQTGLRGYFTMVMDGALAEREALAGKPSPDTYVAAAHALGGAPATAAVLEDALVGVAAGRAGGFLLVVGVDRTGSGAQLRAAGADRVVDDLRALVSP
jgi:HAD superfamily hydrolase (TIGR01509 family)